VFDTGPGSNDGRASGLWRDEGAGSTIDAFPQDETLSGRTAPVNPNAHQSRSWRWPLLAGAAIILGAAIGWFWPTATPPPSETSLAPPAAPATPEPGAFPAARPEPPAASPGVSPPVPVLAPQNAPPASGPPARAALPPAQPLPARNPRGGLLEDPGSEQIKLDKKARRWVESMAGSSPAIQRQLHAGKIVERDRLLLKIADLQDALARDPKDGPAIKHLKNMEEKVFYIERSIEHLEELMEQSP
jgi:hypothetical protein